MENKPGRGKIFRPGSNESWRGGCGGNSGRSNSMHGQQRSGLKLKQGRQRHQQQQYRQQQQQQQNRRQRLANKKPPPFPAFRGPTDRFVDETDPQFSEILETCYDGFSVEGPGTFDPKVHDEAQSAFDGLEEGGVFRADVTQPFGLGTKCAVTYVTRTLVGDPGTSYKYLGLRMFSIPWTQEDSSCKAKGASSGGGQENSVSAALARVRRLNNHLSKRARRLLEEKRTRGRGGAEGRDAIGEELGSCSFNVALINRMEPLEDRPDLKLEPTFGRDRCSVSWHADSCLEHFSTIAVYHATQPHAHPADWRIALRVEPDAEGPSSGKLSSSRNTRDDARAPPIAVPLASRSAYFLLDDFNHHHQHAVLSGTSQRWSSTHRVAKKDGHTFDYISRRCQAVLKDGHKRNLKQWKAEQLTLSELEFEWIRQFYVQGKAHHDLRSWWHRPMSQLLHLWTLLERKTEVVLKTLQGASEARILDGEASTNSPGDKHKHKSGGEDSEAALEERRRTKKARLKRNKQRQAVESLGGQTAFEVIAEALRDRADRRKQWEEREADKVFKRLPEDARPMACPLFLQDAAPSPLPGPPNELRALADAVLAWRNTYTEEDEGGSDKGGSVCTGAKASALARRSNKEAEVGEGRLKRDDGTDGSGDADADDGAERGKFSTGDKVEDKVEDDDSNGRNRLGGCRGGSESVGNNAGSGIIISAGISRTAPPPWETGRFTLEMQAPWSKRLLSGEKTVETRSYPLPAGLFGRPIEVMESPSGQDGVSALGDTVEAFSPGLFVLGRVVFSHSEVYPSRDAWVADEARHLVPPSSAGYGWKGPPGSVYGWTVVEVVAYPKPRAVRCMRRAFRSLFEVECPPPPPSTATPRGQGGSRGGGTTLSKKKKKRKRKGGAAAIRGEADAGARADVGVPKAEAVDVDEETEPARRAVKKRRE